MIITDEELKKLILINTGFSIKARSLIVFGTLLS